MSAAERAKAAMQAADDAVGVEPFGETLPWLFLAKEYEALSKSNGYRFSLPSAAALCRAAASACVEAWQENRDRAEVREELLTVLRETSINQDLGFSIDEPGDVESLGCAVSDYAFRGSNKALRPACSRAAIALLHWRERMVDGE